MDAPIALREVAGAAVVVGGPTVGLVGGGVEPLERGAIVVVGVVDRVGTVAADRELGERVTAVELKLMSPTMPTTVLAITMGARLIGIALTESSC